MLSPEREASPGVILVSSQIYIIYRGLGRDQDIDHCCPGKLFSVLKPKKKTCVLTILGSRFPSGSQDSVSRHLSSQLGIFEELELDKA